MYKVATEAYILQKKYKVLKIIREMNVFNMIKCPTKKIKNNNKNKKTKYSVLGRKKKGTSCTLECLRKNFIPIFMNRSAYNLIHLKKRKNTHNFKLNQQKIILSKPDRLVKTNTKQKMEL